MVYCRLKEIINDKALYDCGKTTSNMTGIIEVYKDGRSPKVIKEPDGEHLRYTYVYAAYKKKQDAISRGEFPDKLSYEI